MRALLVLPIAALALSACSGSSDASRSGTTSSSSATSSSELSGTLTVFAAASLTDVFTELGDRLMADHPGLDVQFNFAGSSVLAAQLTQGAPADVFASADETQMAKEEDAGLAVGPTVFAQNPLMLAVPADNPAGIAPPEAAGIPSLADLVPADLTLAVCAPEVPCGAAAAKVLDVAGLGDAPDTYEDDVRGVLTKVQLGEVDAGLVYVSDVHVAGDKILAFAFRESSLAVNRYPVSVLADAPNPAAAQAFVDLVLSDTGQQVLRDAGFQQP
jgi:molybdate transport system substrate-binding protein